MSKGSFNLAILKIRNGESGNGESLKAGIFKKRREFLKAGIFKYLEQKNTVC